MKKTVIATLLLLMAGVYGAIPAGAQAPTYQTAAVDVNQSGFLYVVYKETGMTPGTQVIYTFQADGEAHYACLPNGYSVPKNKKNFPTQTDTVLKEVLQSWETLLVPRSGRIVDGMALAPPEPSAENVAACAQSGGTYHLVKVSYWNVSLADNQGGTADLTGTCTTESGCTQVLPGK